MFHGNQQWRGLLYLEVEAWQKDFQAVPAIQETQEYPPTSK